MYVWYSADNRSVLAVTTFLRVLMVFATPGDPPDPAWDEDGDKRGERCNYVAF